MSEKVSASDLSGEIVRIEYDTVVGSVRGDDFYIDISEDGIAETTYFSEDDRDDHTVENKKLNEGQWQEIMETAYSFADTLEEVQSAPAKKESEDADEDYFELDGPNYTHYYLTWESDGEQRYLRFRCIYNENVAKTRFNGTIYISG